MILSLARILLKHPVVHWYLFKIFGLWWATFVNVQIFNLNQFLHSQHFSNLRHSCTLRGNTQESGCFSQRDNSADFQVLHCSSHMLLLTEAITGSVDLVLLACNYCCLTVLKCDAKLHGTASKNNNAEKMCRQNHSIFKKLSSFFVLYIRTGN